MTGIKANSGFSLIELMVFIAILGMAGVTLLVSFQTVLQQSPTTYYQTTAISLAQGRMALIFGQRQLQGFSTFSDPCKQATPPTSCALPGGYQITTAINAYSLSGDSNYKLITVTVSGLGSATLTALVGS